jgi:L-alanine-DL-glutamate epimerase-like enolase superfamily enzyme
MGKKTDVTVQGVEVYFLPVETRVPLKFGPETLTSVTVLRVRMRVRDRHGRVADGWGETPLSVQWAWPGPLSYEERFGVMRDFSLLISRKWAEIQEFGHPIEVGWDFVEGGLARVFEEVNAGRQGREPMPWLAALIVCSAFDIALHDAYGKLLEHPVYETYSEEFMNRDLGSFLEPAAGEGTSFVNRYPSDYLVREPVWELPAWHLVGGKDPVSPEELTGSEPDDGYPVLLKDWIRRDGLTCLKIKLRGNDSDWDYARLVAVGEIAFEQDVRWLTADFNCTVTEPGYVNDILDRLLMEKPRTWQSLLYVEQPFPYDLEENCIDVHSLSTRKPLFMDESAHDWRLVRLGRSLGWTGVALKTCKTQSGALLAACWARTHGMELMVQDLTNPMLAQIPHCLLAARMGTIMGVETNAMQFYPDASLPEAAVHPGLFQRRGGQVDLTTIQGPGFGYQLEKIERELPEPALVSGDVENDLARPPRP